LWLVCQFGWQAFVFVVVVTGWVGLVPATLRTVLLLYLAAVRSVTFSGVRDLNWCASF
jgi:hypothetical protein